MNRFTLVALCSLLICASCDHFWGKRIHGNGNIRKESRTVGSFSSVEVSGAIDVYLTQGGGSSIDIETDENLLGYVVTQTDGERLIIRPRDQANLAPTHAVKVFVTAPAYRLLHASGASKIISEGRINSGEGIDVEVSGASEARVEVTAPKITSQLSGASKVTIRGETKDFAVECDGASHARCFDLLSENADVDVSGASSAEVFASVKLKGDASGASRIRYKGNATVSINTSGASSQDKAD